MTIASEAELARQLDRACLPRHVAVIMDGNRRWAKTRRLPSIMGHRAGVKAFRAVMETCRELGVSVLTAYAFSAENWSRSPTEVRVLMQLFEHYTRAECDKMVRTGIRFVPIGRLELLPEPVARAFAETAQATAHNTDMTLQLAVNYSGRDEILQAARQLAREAAAGQLDPDSLDEAAFADRLWTSKVPDPDLLIRTSGELRVSNFLLWQMAYTEFYFTDLFWPDITRSVLFQAFLAYQQRERRYGAGE